MFVGVVGVVTSCVPCARVPRVARDVIPIGCSSCATENTYTPARLEALFKLSVVTILSHSYHFHQICCGLWVLSPTRHLVHVNAYMFLSGKIDQFRMLSLLSLDITAIFATGYTLYFVSAVL